MPLLHFENITRSFGSSRALAGADFSMERGEILALMGENGAGTSTLVKIHSGVLPADGGT
ncbi:ATP-binding cassette domain-containing protein, partial [Rhizobium ruizarguesonis]